MDLNSDGLIERSEILEDIHTRVDLGLDNSVRALILDAFSQADVDGDGALDGAETQYMAALILQRFGQEVPAA